MNRTLLLVLLVACKKDSTPAAGSGAGDCASAITAAIDRAAHTGIDQGANGGAPKGEVDRIKHDLDASLAPVKAATIKACTEDHWSAEALACIASKLKLDGCADQLTAEQNKHVGELVAAATNKTGTPACEKYAKLEMECGGAPADAKPTILDFCAKAATGASDVTYQLIALETGCAQTAADCAAYKTCVDDKKAATKPH
ncbi:MAG: hypothetical protein ABI678_16340 [Kofleriaceae bacterium]